jgi:hypothetical protein
VPKNDSHNVGTVVELRGLSDMSEDDAAAAPPLPLFYDYDTRLMARTENKGSAEVREWEIDEKLHSL